MQGVEHPHRLVGEPVNLFQGQLFAVKLPKKPAAALGAEVESEVVGGRFGGRVSHRAFCRNRLSGNGEK